MINGAHEIIKIQIYFLSKLAFIVSVFCFLFVDIFGNIYAYIRRAQRLKHCACSILYVWTALGTNISNYIIESPE